MHVSVVANAKITKMEKKVDGKYTAGTFQGYAATWDVDKEKQRFVKGCFAKSIMERGAAIPVMIRHGAHGGDALEQVGLLAGAHEDEIGLAVSGKFFDDPLSKSIREKVIAGAPRFLSVGFTPMQGKLIDGIFEHTEVKFEEVTITNFPANEQAKILDAKSMEPNSPSRVMAETTQWVEQEGRRLALLEVSSDA